MDVDIDLIKPSPYQPRLFFEVDDLKEEIQRDGLLSALVVRKRDEYYELLDGERRLRVLKDLGWKTVPVDIRDVNDVTAKRSVFKLNLVRQNYKTEEKAKYFKKLADEGAKAYQIGMDLNIDDNLVRAHLNVFLFPEDVQQAVWADQLSIALMRELEPLIGANPEEATIVAREAITRKMTQKQLHETLKPIVKEIEEARVKAAQKAIEEQREKLGDASPISLETPEDLEKAAMVLKKEARRRAEEAMTPEEKAKEERRKLVAEARKFLDSTAKKIDRASQVVDVSEFRERLNNIQQTLEKAPGEAKAQLTALGQQVTEAENKAKAEAKAKQEEEQRQKKAEEERRRQERADKRARAELKEDKAFIQESLRAMPEEERVEILGLVPIPGKPKQPKSLTKQFQEVVKDASQLVTKIERLTAEPGFGELDLEPFALDLHMLADAFTELSGQVGGVHEKKKSNC